MYRTKVYKSEPGKCALSSSNHALVRSAAAMGLTNIKITHHMGGRDAFAKKGWTLESAEVPYLHLGLEVKESLTRISEIKLPTKN